jgi:Cu(I)/Ag(I) efflux system membrane fusion protein
MSLRTAALFGVLMLGCSAGASAPAAAVSGIVPVYNQISADLAADKLDAIAALSGDLGKQAQALEGKPGIAKVTAALPGLARNDLATVRQSFKNVSDGVIEYMRSDATTQTGSVIVFCPMAFNDKGALWVQAEGKIANPYYGASMLRCGNKLGWTDELPKTAEL